MTASHPIVQALALCLELRADLDAIARQTDTVRAELLRAIAQAGLEDFTAAEAIETYALHPTILAAVGELSARKLGSFLARECENKVFDGLTVVRLTDSATT